MAASIEWSVERSLERSVVCSIERSIERSIEGYEYRAALTRFTPAGRYRAAAFFLWKGPPSGMPEAYAMRTDA